MLRIQVSRFPLAMWHAHEICILVIDSVLECVRWHFWVIYAAHKLFKGVKFSVGWKLNFQTSWTLSPKYFYFSITVFTSSTNIPDFLKDFGPSWIQLGWGDGPEDGHEGWQPEFNPQDSDGGKRTDSHMLPSVHWYPHTYCTLTLYLIINKSM